MGDPKKHRKKYSTPLKAWEKSRIDEEKAYIREYHFKNKQEIWKLIAKLKHFSNQAKNLIKSKTAQAEKERIQLLDKVKSLGLIEESGQLDDVLGISDKDLMERRLQTIVLRKGFARSMKQARQFIVHEHILVDGRKVTSPNLLVKKAVEGSVMFSPDSALTDEMHPERIQEEKLAKKPKAEKTPKEKSDTPKKEEKHETEETPKPKKEVKKEEPKK